MQDEGGTAFGEIAPFYDELMRGVPYGMWVRYLQDILQHRGADARRVIDLACGTGNVAFRLAECGYEVTGVDISAAMVGEARRKAAANRSGVAFEVQDAADLRLLPPPYDLCVSFFDSLNNITRSDRLLSAMRSVCEHLVPGGLFVFDVNTRYALENRYFDQACSDPRERLRYNWRSDFDPVTRLCTISMQFWLREEGGATREFHETHVQYAYEEGELRRLLQQAGFADIEAFHAYTLRPVQPCTDRMFVVASRPAACT
ncbi:MAG TPA: class I SAM-dependent methyltransferase [Chthonomonadales bacterium]|nr:class I SAM-dependent methyltransferase [Chthonomonadales bacterium]